MGQRILFSFGSGLRFVSGPFASESLFRLRALLITQLSNSFTSKRFFHKRSYVFQLPHANKKPGAKEKSGIEIYKNLNFEIGMKLLLTIPSKF